MTGKITSIAVVAALMTSGAAMPAALAQDVEADAGVELDAGAGAGAGAGANTDAGSADGSGKAGVSANTGAAADAGADAGLSAITQDDTIEIVQLSEVEGSANAAAKQQVFAEAQGRDASWQSQIESGVEANTALTTALEEEGFTAEDVVDVRAGANGTIVVFVDDTA